MSISRRALFGKLHRTSFRAVGSATAFAGLQGTPYAESTPCTHETGARRLIGVTEQHLLAHLARDRPRDAMACQVDCR